jgi:UDP-N-acetylglucosamine 3-dehydrogenase
VTRIALIGLGAMGRNHLRVLADLDGSQLAAVCDQDQTMVEAVSHKYGVPGYASWSEMLEKEVKLDAAVVAVPTRFHLEAGLAVLKRGLHVLIEKPIAVDLAEGRQLIAAAKDADRTLAVGHIERFNPAVRQLQRRVAAGEIGRIFQLQARRQGPFPARIRDVGVVIDLATHDLDVMHQLAGSEVQRLYAETEQRIHTDHEDILNALLKFDSGVLGVLQVNWLTPTKIREVTVLGERGMFVCNYLTQELTHYKNADVPSPDALSKPRAVTEGEAVTFPIAQAEPLRLELESFVGAVKGDHEVEVDGEAGLRALHLALALVASASDARVIRKPELERLWSGAAVGHRKNMPRGTNRDDL